MEKRCPIIKFQQQILNNKINNNIKKLKVELVNSEVSIYDLFKKIEIIPLETTDSSLFTRIDKIVLIDNQFYTFVTSAFSAYFCDVFLSR